MIRFPFWLPSKNADRSSVEARINGAFSDGYMLAMKEGIAELSSRLRDQAIEESLNRLEPLIESRVQAIGLLKPRALMELNAKEEELRRKLMASTTMEDKIKYTHYLEALDWMLHADKLHPNQS